MNKELISKYGGQIYYLMLLVSIGVAILFTYMTFIFRELVGGTKYVAWTYLIASPILFSMILVLALVFVGKNQTVKELAEFIGGLYN